MKKTFAIFGLLKYTGKTPEETAKILSETLFYKYKTEFHDKGFLTVYFDKLKE